MMNASEGMRYARACVAQLGAAGLSVCSGAVHAAEAVAPTAGSAGVRMAVGLIFVLALIGGAAWLLKRLGKLPGSQGNQLKVVSALAVGARERVLLVQAGETQLLIGVAPGRVSALHVLDLPVVSATVAHATTALPVGDDFAQRLKNLLGDARK